MVAENVYQLWFCMLLLERLLSMEKNLRYSNSKDGFVSETGDSNIEFKSLEDF